MIFGIAAYRRHINQNRFLGSDILLTDMRFKDSSLKFNELPSQVTEVHQPVCTSVHDPVQTFTIRHNKTSLKVDLWNNSRHGHPRSRKVTAEKRYLRAYFFEKMTWKMMSKSWTFECLMDVKNVSKRKLARKCILKLYLMRGWEQNNFD